MAVREGVTYRKLFGRYSLPGADTAAAEAARSIDEQGAFLRKAVNVDITAQYKARRRDGMTALSSSAGYHSLSEDGNPILLVRSGTLHRVASLRPYSEVVLRAGVGDLDMSYASMLGRKYFTNGAVIGYVEGGAALSLTDPDQTFMAPLPSGHLIEFWNGRLLLAAEDVVIVSEVFADYYDTRDDDSIWGLGGPATMVKGVTDGVYVSDDQRVYFFAGTDAKDVTVRDIDNAPAIKGTARTIRRLTLTQGNAVYRFDLAVAWASRNGIFVGGDGGQVFNLTEKTYLMPSLGRAAGVAIKDVGSRINQVVINIR